MSILYRKTRFGTKFLSVLIANLIILPFEGIFYDWYSNTSIFYIIMGTFKQIAAISIYSVFIATIWKLIETNKSFDTQNNKLGIIAISCIFGTIIDVVKSFNVMTQAAINMHYLGTALEIFLIFNIEKLFILLSTKPKFVRKIFNFCDRLTLIYIYAIVAQCFLSWMPDLNWNFLPLKIFWHIVGPYMNLFEQFVPPIVGIDFTPILAVMVLVFIRKQLGLYLLNIITNSDIENEECSKTDADSNSHDKSN